MIGPQNGRTAHLKDLLPERMAGDSTAWDARWDWDGADDWPRRVREYEA